MCAQEKQPVEKGKLKTDLRGNDQWSKSPGRWWIECVSLKKEDNTSSFDIGEKEEMSGKDGNFLGKRV